MKEYLADEEWGDGYGDKVLGLEEAQKGEVGEVEFVEGGSAFEWD